MLSGDSGAEPSPPALLAQTWQATLILGALTLILGFEIIGGLMLRRELRAAVMSLT